MNDALYIKILVSTIGILAMFSTFYLREIYLQFRKTVEKVQEHEIEIQLLKAKHD